MSKLKQSSILCAVPFALFISLVSANAQPAAYVVDIQGQVSASPWAEFETKLLYPGAMLESKTRLDFGKGSKLSVVCEEAGELIRVSSSLELQQQCFQEARELDNMRSSGSSKAPIILHPRQEQVLEFDQVIWRSDVDAKFRIEITKLDGKKNPIVYSETPDNIASKQEVLTTYSYGLPKDIGDSLLPGQAYRVLIQNMDNGENSGLDGHSGVFSLADENTRTRLEDFEEDIVESIDDKKISQFIYAVKLKEEGLYQESLSELGALFTEIAGQSKYQSLSADVQFQIAENHQRQRLGADFITVKLLKAIVQSGDNTNSYTGYLACDRLAFVIGSLPPIWQKKLEGAFRKPDFKTTCPLLAGA